MPEDDRLGAVWLRAAAECGHSEAQYMLWNYLREGSLSDSVAIRKNFDEARLWLARAAEQGHEKAVADLNICQKNSAGYYEHAVLEALVRSDVQVTTEIDYLARVAVRMENEIDMAARKALAAELKQHGVENYLVFDRVASWMASAARKAFIPGAIHDLLPVIGGPSAAETIKRANGESFEEVRRAINRRMWLYLDDERLEPRLPTDSVR